MHDHDAPPQKYTGFKLPAVEVDTLAACGKFYGRSLDAELKLSVRILLRMHNLVAISRDPESIAARGVDPGEAYDRMRAELDELLARAFDRPAALDLFELEAAWRA
jgi:hypothetical protein